MHRSRLQFAKQIHGISSFCWKFYAKRTVTLGAQQRDVLRLVVGLGILLAIVGAAVGIGVALAVT